MKKVSVDYFKKLKKALQKQKLRQIDLHREHVRLNPENPPLIFSNTAYTDLDVTFLDHPQL